MRNASGCPSVADLQRLLTGAVADIEAESLEQHLQECAPCFQRLKTLSVEDALVEALHGQANGEGSWADAGIIDELIPQLKALCPPMPAHGSRVRTIPASPSAPRPALPVVPGYEVLSELGRGGMGVVYLARQRGVNRLVALKMLRAADLAGPHERARFRREAEAVGRLRHPNIVQIYDVGGLERQPYFSMEFMDGGSLAQPLKGMPQPPREAAVLAETLARAVHFAHQQGIVHRDLKPANILLQRGEGRGARDEQDSRSSALAPRPSSLVPIPKIADFGLAKWLGADDVLSRSGDLMGTPAYMAPEQAAGQKQAIGPATDVYALGAILYELLTGRPLFRGETTLETLEQVRSQEPVPPTRLQPRLPRDLDTICLKCLRKEPSRRYASAEALAEDLRRFQAGEPIQARPVGTLERAWRWCRRHPGAALAGILAAGWLLGLVAIAIIFAFQQAGATRNLRAEQEKTQAALRQSEEMNLKLSLDRGLTLCGKGDVASGMLWLARALELAPEEAGATAHAVRRNLAAWRPRLHAVRAVLPVPQTADKFWNVALLDAVAFSPDGATLVGNSGQRKTLLLWDVASGRLRGETLEHPEPVARLAFHPDGSLVAAYPPRRIRFWDVRTETLLREHFLTEEIHRVAVSRAGTTLLISDVKGTIHFYAIGPDKSLTPTGTLPDMGDGVLAMSPDGRLFATGSGKTVQVRDLATRWPVGPALPHRRHASAAAFSPDGSTIVTAGDGGAWLWQVPTGKPLWTFAHPTSVPAVAFGPDGRTILLPGTDATVALVEAATGKPLSPPVRLARPVWTVAFSPDGRTFATPGGIGDTVLLWETRHDAASDRILRMSHLIATLRFHADGTMLTGGANVGLRHSENGSPQFWRMAGELALQALRPGEAIHGEAQLWDPATRLPHGPPLTHAQPVMSAAFSSADEAQCLLGSCHPDTAVGDARLWDLASRRPLAQPTHGRGGGVPAVAFSPDARTYVTGGTDHVAKLWDAAAGQCRFQMDHLGAVRGVAYSPDGRTLLTGSEDQTAQRWDAATGHRRGAPLRHPASVASVAFSPDGKYVLTGCQDNHARIWDPETGQVLQTFTHQGWVMAAVFSPDGRLVLTGSVDGTARLWDRVTGLPIGPPVQHDKALLPGLDWNWVPAVTFSPDGRTLVTGGLDQTARFRPVPPPLAGTPERVGVWVEVITGMTLDAAGTVHALNAGQWQERRRRLEELGGPPDQPSAQVQRPDP